MTVFESITKENGLCGFRNSQANFEKNRKQKIHNPLYCLEQCFSSHFLAGFYLGLPSAHQLVSDHLRLHNNKLISLNSQYPFEENSENDHVKVLGKVIGIVIHDSIAKESNISELEKMFSIELQEFYKTH